jgi:hypothetical protein
MITLSPLEVRFTATFSVPLRGQPVPDTSRVAQEVSRALRTRHARNVAVSGDRIVFEGPGILATGKWALLAHVDGGEMSITSDAEALHIRYTLRYTRFAILGTVIALVFATIVGLMSGLVGGLMVFVLFELVVCIANVSFSHMRMRDFFEVTADTAVRGSELGRLTSA